MIDIIIIAFFIVFPCLFVQFKYSVFLDSETFQFPFAYLKTKYIIIVKIKIPVKDVNNDGSTLFYSVTTSDLFFSLLIKYKTLPKYIRKGIPLPIVIAKRKLL